MAADLKAFQDFVKSRAEAEATHSRAFLANGADRGALVLIGIASESALIEKLAELAKGVPDAGLSKVVKGSISEAASASRNTILVCTADKQSDDVDTSRNAPVVYVRSDGAHREAWAVSRSTHEFEALAGEDSYVNADFCRLVKLLRCPPAPCLGPGSYFVSLTYPDVSQAMETGKNWTPPPFVVSEKGSGPLHDGLEVRADLLKSYDETFILSQLAMVRRQSEGLPIIFTVRSKIQGGAFEGDEAEFWKLTTIGLRFGVEYVDIEAGWTRQGRAAFYNMTKRSMPGVRIIGSHHDVQRPLSDISDHDLCELFNECAFGPDGSIDIVKVVGRAESAQCSIRVNQAAMRIRDSLPKSVHSVIAICTTDSGRLSRALNVLLGPTPVAHPSLPGKAAPGQLSAVEIETIRQKLGLPINPFRAAVSASQPLGSDEFAARKARRLS
eukprot:TRINITY_DN22567_c0_g1_i1.p1 TRINITY_DN22567_c0_g1~~TRINITY_DN22567_c0_g1_i1.p1  ORF type:complete len:441 (-),score=60.98 TRINITY_DN22567_c0_g1_i1:128-1450(-)